MIPPRDILDYLVAELRVGARAPADVLSHLRVAWTWDVASASQLRSDIREARDGGRLSEAEAGDLSRGIETWLDAMSEDDPTESIDDPAIVAMQLTRESHAGVSLELRPGVVLRDRYVLGEPIARGGQSIVFRAYVLRDDADAGAAKPVAIKVLKDASPSAAAVARLKREFRQTQLLRDAGVADMFDLGCDRNTWFIAMELLEGMSLRTRLNRTATQPLTRPECLRILADCGAVLARAHRHGFAHGDVKPGNLFLQDKGGIKVLDFGAAYDIQPAPSVSAYEAGATAAAATRTYASPELLDGLAVEPRDDIFSLACVAYEMLAGRHPFSRVPANEARDREMEVQPIPGLAQGQNEALANALAWSRTRRPSSIEAWLQALLDEKTDASARPKPAFAIATPSEWLPWRWIGAVGAVAALLLAAMWWESRSSDEKTIAPMAAASPSPRESPLQDEPAAAASALQSTDDAARTPESTVTTPPAETSSEEARTQASSDAKGATSAGNVVRPARAAPVDPVRIEADTPSIRISEGAPAAVVVLRRSGNLAAPVNVTWQLQDGSAHAGEDYTTPADRSARFAAGQTTRAIYVPLVNDDRPEPEKFFSLVFQSPGAEGTSRVTITIVDDD
jgi:serine/threonine protein kinase